ncbi:MAG TPA: M10 family metallopeptidase C-terminal domain-containing protein, partial [Candidatus Binatia bacterium]|nr:M10 family metallopeptidase C-terminal domain-containing protein [Candidatus Binatia bacterium]
MMRERMLSLRAWQPRDADGSPPMARPLQDPFDATASPGAAPDKGGSTPEFFLPPSPGSLVNGLPVLSWDQAAAQLTRGGYSWSTTNGEPIVITYAFRASVSAFELSQLPAGVSGFAQFNAIQIAVVDEIMRLWSEVANIQLVRVGEGTSGPGAYSNNASILLGNYTTGPAAFSAFAFLPSPTAAGAADLEGNIWVNVSRNYDADPLTFSLGAQILVHEIGHALGLLHPEDYGGGANGGANYIDDATFWQDTSQFMTMSYFSPSFTGANFGINARAPQMHDIAAAQLLYGPNTTTRTGDTTYGFNSNSGHSVFSIGAANQASVFTIWDAGGTDTLDLSGYTTNSEIDLREQAFSSAGPGNGGPAVYNIAIARGAVIENAIGGAGADTLIGNAADNVLTGNAGADSINGNGGIDTANYDGSNAAVSVNLATGEALGGHAQGDTFQSIESLIGTAFDDTLTGDAEANSISGLGGADTLNGGDGNDTLYGHSAGATGEINVVAIATGMGASPLSTGAATPADAGFLYIVQKDTGVIFRVDEATGARTTFLDVQDTLFSGGGERGVLGLAFHPNYSGNGRFFVFLTDPQGDLQVREYHRSSTDPAVADNASTLVIEIPKQTGFTNHNGGWIGFSPDDGYLYVATGDGGGAGDPGNNSQDLNDLLGKILRINVDADGFPADAARNYAVPANNPFVGIAGADEIWAYGVRNPWRLAFDPRNGDLYIADVGQSAREEVNFQSAGFAGGANYGWRIMEGTLTFNPGPPGTPQPGDPSLTLPVYEYGRFFGGSITGGEVYVGANAGMTGHYVFADYLSGRLFTLMMHNGAAVNAEDRSPQITGAELTNVVDFVTGATGQLYA